MAIAVLCVCLYGTAPCQEPPLYRTPRVAATTPTPEERTDINHASLDELLKVPGMTQSWAGRIVRFRPYHSKQDLVERGVVTSQVYSRIKDSVIAHRDKK
jgi:DNA uptake protein ComE-like DNA-binding protein